MRKFIFGGSYTSFVWDTDALAYFNANTAITSDTDKLAIDAFYKGLKSDGIYTKMKTMYLPIWGSASSNKWNILNPLDSDSAFRMSFVGGWTHSFNGILGNGTNSYANTYFNALTQSLNNNSYSIGFYSTINSNTGIDCGADAGYSQFYFHSRWGLLGNISRFYTNSPLDVSDANSLGFYVAKQGTGTTKKIFKNNSQIASSTFASGVPFSNFNIYLGALNRNGSASFISGKRYSFFYISDGLTDTDASNLYLRVQTLMTYFGINV